MLIVIFTYNREQMLKSLLEELKDSEHEVLIIDDKSDYNLASIFYLNRPDWTIYEPLEHKGKQRFWEQWHYAFNEIQSSTHEYICFLPDDVCNLDLKSIERFTKQGWDNMRFAINLSNSGTRYRWGKWSTGQPDFEINDMLLQECGYVDGLFITNRHTLEGVTIDPVPESWFTRPDKSSGVGYQLSMKLREKHVKMMIPEYSYCYHGDHESVMHKEHRKAVPLISKLK